MSVSLAIRMKKRSTAISAAVKRARDRRGWSLRKLALEARVSPSTLSRLENSDGSESPRVETVDALAVALDCPLAELLGDPPVVEYRGFGDWPGALQEVLEARGGDVTPAERAFFECQITLANNTALSLDDDARSADAQDASHWERQIVLFQCSPIWRTVSDLITQQYLLDHGAQTGLERVVRSLIEARLAPAPNFDEEPVKKKKKRATKGGKR